MFNTNFSNNKVKDICVGTFNVRTLKSRLSRLELGGEMDRYGIDILCIQETKCLEYEEFLLSCGSRCILLPSTKLKRHGIGFVVAPRMAPYLKKVKAHSDRIGVATFRGEGDTAVHIVNVYSPHEG